MNRPAVYLHSMDSDRNPFVAWFWQGLALCYQGMQQNEDALFAYGWP